MVSSDYLITALLQLAGAAPVLIFWIGVIVFGSIMLGRGGGRAERFIIAGGAVKVLATLCRIPLALSSLWIINSGYDLKTAATISSGIGIAVNVISAIGTLCLIYAFWLKFKEWKMGETATIELERGPHDAVPQ